MELATRPERSARVSFTIHLKAFSLLLYALPFGGRASSLLIMGGHAGKWFTHCLLYQDRSLAL